ncbi:MAG: type III secretion system chaperone family protein [Cellulomonas sp.]
MTFLDDVAAALVRAGRSLEVDPALSTIDVSSAAAGPVLAVVRPIARAVTFYVVHPVLVPAVSVAAVSELVVRATADLVDASLELDLATGAVAVRFGVVLGELDLAEDDLAELLDAGLDTVETAAAQYTGAIDDVLAGVEPRTASTAVRRAPVDLLAAELDDA